MALRKHLAAQTLLALALLAFGACGFAQTPATLPTPPAPTMPPTGTPLAKPSPVQSAAPAPSAASSRNPLSLPAQPAKVSLVSGKLTIHADNSSLSDILSQISKAGGMKVSGTPPSGSPDPRIFGVYGPGSPGAVLSDLLDGCGYNVMMLGETPAGTPRELALSPRASGGVPNPTPQQQPVESVQREDYNNQPQPAQYPQPQAQPRRNGIRTPQEILQQLEQMRQQQQQPLQQSQPQ